MGTRASLAILGLCAAAVAAGCASRGGARAGAAGTGKEAIAVLDGDRLQAAIASGASVTQILSTRVPSVRLLRTTGPGSGECPTLIVRGVATFRQTLSPPDIYIDNARAQDSCVLYTLVPEHLRAIEVYAGGAQPAGVPLRPNTGGAIIVRTRMN
jgi:hypothetical protein